MKCAGMCMCLVSVVSRYYLGIILNLTKEILTISVVISSMNSLPEPTPQELDEFRYILNIHKYLVKRLGEIFNSADYSSHDDSKLSEPELTPYTLRFIRNLHGNDNPMWSVGKNHHFQNNRHHIEYWKFVGKEMPFDCLCEAIVDMMAAKLQYQIHPGIVEEVRIDQHTVDYNKLMEILNVYLTKPDMYFFADRFLGEYSAEQQNMIKKKLQDFQKVFENNYHIEL